MNAIEVPEVLPDPPRIKVQYFTSTKLDGFIAGDLVGQFDDAGLLDEVRPPRRPQRPDGGPGLRRQPRNTI